MPRLVRLLMSDELVYFSVVWVVSVVSRMFEVTFKVPADPGVCDVNESETRYWCTTQAVTPMLALLIARASPASVLFDERLMVCVAPLPT